MDDPIIIESPKVEDEEEETTIKDQVQEPEIVTGSTSPPPTPLPAVIDYGKDRKLARDAKAKRKDEKTVQQVLKSLDNLKSPEEKLSAMCKKYSELLHENRQLQGTVKQSEKNIIMIHREKEQFRHERSKAVLAKTRMEQLCRELQKLNKAQQEETALKLKVEEEKRKEICFTFQTAFAEMNLLTNQNNEKSAKMREENLEMKEKIKSVRERIELTETQLDKVRQQAKLELELTRERLIGVTLELKAEKEALMKDKTQLLMKLAKYHVRVKEHEGTEQFLRKQIKIYEEKFEEFKKDVNKTTESLKNFRPESREMKKKMLKVEKETALWKQRWEKTNAAVVQMTEIKEKRDAEMVTLNNKLSTLQELCKVFQRERTSLLAQLREKNDTVAQTDRNSRQSSVGSDENRKSLKQVENISKDCEKLKDNLSKLEGSLSEAVREAFKATVYEEESVVDAPKTNKKINKKTKKIDQRNKTNQKKDEGEEKDEKDENADQICEDNRSPGSIDSKPITEDKTSETIPVDERFTNDQSEKSLSPECEDSDNRPGDVAIIESHETVVKDIEKFIGEQAIFEAEIVRVEQPKSDAPDADVEIPPSDNKFPENLPIADNQSPETLPIADDELPEKIDHECEKDSSADDHRTIVDPENPTADNDNGLSISEFEIVHYGSCEPDGELSTDLVDPSVIDQPKVPPNDSISKTTNSGDSLETHTEDVSGKAGSCDSTDRIIEPANVSLSPTNDNSTC